MDIVKLVMGISLSEVSRLPVIEKSFQWPLEMGRVASFFLVSATLLIIH